MEIDRDDRSQCFATEKLFHYVSVVRKKEQKLENGIFQGGASSLFRGT